MPEPRPTSRREARRRERGETLEDLATAGTPRRRSRRERREASWWLGTLWKGLAVVALVLLIGTYTFLPPLLGFVAGQGLQGRFGLDDAPQVDLRSEPPPEMLVGRFAWARIVMGQPDFGGVRPERVTIDLDPFDVDVPGSVRSGSFRSRQPLSGEIRVLLSEENLAAIADAGTKGLPIRGVDLSKKGAVVRLGADVLGVEVPVSVEGDFRLEGDELVFRPDRVAAFGVTLPKRLSERLLDGSDFSYPLDDLPYGAEIEEVETAEGRIVLSGTVERIPLGKPAG